MMSDSSDEQQRPVMRLIHKKYQIRLNRISHGETPNRRALVHWCQWYGRGAEHAVGGYKQLGVQGNQLVVEWESKDEVWIVDAMRIIDEEGTGRQIDL